MLLKSLAIGAALLASLPCAAQDYEKNGMPCLAEICIGDGLPELAKVKWDTASAGGWVDTKTTPILGTKVTPLDMTQLKAIFPQPTAAAAVYLKHKKFDNAAIASLNGVTVACGENEMTGSFTTASGNPTIVIIRLMADATDPSKQSWRVSKILRKFPKAVTSEQMEEVRKQLKERYVKYDVNNSKLGNAKPGDGRVSLSGYSDIQFGMYMQGGVELNNRLKMHPACGGAAKVKID